jgi:hypothetical protein
MQNESIDLSYDQWADIPSPSADGAPVAVITLREDAEGSGRVF